MEQIEFLEVERGLSAFRSSSLPVLLFITHRLGGGVDRHVSDLIGALQGRADVLVLRPSACAGVLHLSWGDPAGFLLGFDSLKVLACAVEWLGVSAVHVHHLIGYPAGFERFLFGLAVPLDLTLHDHSIINGNPTLTDGSGVFDPGCLIGEVALPAGDAALSSSLRLVAMGARRIFTPSYSLADTVGIFLPGVAVSARGAPDSEGEIGSGVLVRPLAVDESMRVLCLGAFTVEKGARILADVARSAERQGARLRFILLGESHFPMPESVRVLGRYDDSQLDCMLDEVAPHLIWLPAQCPETWSYTLTAALASATPVLASNIGALPERLVGRPYSWVLAHRAGVDGWLSELLRIRSVLSVGAGLHPWRSTSAAPFYSCGGGYLLSGAGSVKHGSCPFSLQDAVAAASRAPSWVRVFFSGVASAVRRHPRLGRLLGMVPRRVIRFLKRMLAF